MVSRYQLKIISFQNEAISKRFTYLYTVLFRLMICIYDHGCKLHRMSSFLYFQFDTVTNTVLHVFNGVPENLSASAALEWHHHHSQRTSRSCSSLCIFQLCVKMSGLMLLISHIYMSVHKYEVWYLMIKVWRGTEVRYTCWQCILFINCRCRGM